ncbi:MAG TPA: sulfur carrier protein ThiS [Rudaea sp.]|jgi:sulfur carrier protein|nr:sulfur carrier protein ThiS [Rudaea sp.]
MPTIHLNGRTFDVDNPISVSALLEANGYAHRAVAVEINREIVPKSTHTQRHVVDGDNVEIVEAMGGG